MKHLCLILLISITNFVFAQTTVSVDSFFPSKTQKPDNYKELIFNADGWTFVAAYFPYNKSISTNSQDIGQNGKIKYIELKNNYPKTGFSNIKGDKIVSYGDNDRRSTSKIIYIDDHTLIIETKVFRAGKVIKKKSGVLEEQRYVETIVRVIYKR